MAAAATGRHAGCHVAPRRVHNNQRDGPHRQAIHRGRVSYEPNSLAGGCPFQAGTRGFVSVPEPMRDDKVRGKPAKFAEHFAQATMFFRSQTPVEQQHISAAFRFELSRVTVPAIRSRMVALLRNVDESLAAEVAEGLGLELPPAQTPMVDAGTPEIEVSQALSLMARPGDGSVRGRRVALLVAHGVDGVLVRAAASALMAAEAVPRFVGQRLGAVQPIDGPPIEVEATVETMPSVLWDAMLIPGGSAALATLAADAQVIDFVKEQYRHAKPIWVLDGGSDLLTAAGVPQALPDGQADPGLVIAGGGAEGRAADFIDALSRHRHFAREMDPPAV